VKPRLLQLTDRVLDLHTGALGGYGADLTETELGLLEYLEHRVRLTSVSGHRAHADGGGGRAGESRAQSIVPGADQLDWVQIPDLRSSLESVRGHTIVSS